MAYKETLSRHRRVMVLGNKKPQISASEAFVAPSASVIGDVTMGAQSSVWYGAVVRGDVNHITIGNMSNIQDRAVVHVNRNNVSGVVAPTNIGDHVTVGPNALIHGCDLKDRTVV